MHSLPLVMAHKMVYNFKHNRESILSKGSEEQKDLVRSIAISSNVMPSSPSEVKLSKISTPPPPQSTNNNYNSNGLISKNLNTNGNHSPTHISGKTCLSPSPPNPHVTSRSLSTSNTSDSVSIGSSIGSSSVRQISKLKRFLTTLYHFANDISSDVGDRVRALIIGLVNSTISTEEFHQKIQESTNYPLRPYVIPFLKLHLPILQTDLVHFARLAKISPAQYLREHESLILDSSTQTTALTAGEPFEIFQRNEPTKESQTKRRPSPEMVGKENGFVDNMNDRESGPPPSKRHQPLLSPSIGTRLSPAGLAPLLLHGSGHHHSHHISNPSILHSHLSTSGRSMFDESNTASSPLYHNSTNSRDNNTNGRNHSSGEHLNDRYSSVAERFEREYCRPAVGLYSGLQRDYSDDRDMEDEWKNIHTMLNCILGMVEKTKRALAILQHRSDTRSSEFASNAMWNVSSLRGRHFNPLEVSHSSHDFHEMKKPRVDNLLSNHFQKSTLSEMDRITDIRRPRPGAHQHLEEAVNEVKRQAVAELQKAVSAAETKATELVAAERIKMEKLVTDARRQAAEEALVAISQQDDSTENCWNCGRKASETCSGCNVARYCGSFCQHKDWENHHRVCQNTSTNGSNGSVAQTSICAEKRSKSRSPTPASNTSGSVSNKNSTSASSGSAGDSRDNKIKNE